MGSGLGLPGPWEREIATPPLHTHTSSVSPVDHGSLVATLLIAKTEAGVGGGGVEQVACVLGASVFEGR